MKNETIQIEKEENCLNTSNHSAESKKGEALFSKTSEKKGKEDKGNIESINANSN
jgi:hypothetical protein